MIAVQMTGGEALARQLAAEGVRDLFGVPGIQLDYVLDGLTRAAPEIRFYGTRHEQAAAYMADGYARATGDVGAFLVVPGPGVLNAGAGLATAYACSSRVLCIASQIPSWAQGRRLGVLHEIEGQSALLDSLTKLRVTAHTPEEVPQAVRTAMKALRSGRPRPVALEIGADVFQARADVELIEADARNSEPLSPDPAAIDRAVDILRQAERPVIYAGGGVVASGGGDAVLDLAEQIEAPIVLSRGGRGAISDRHRLVLSSVAGRQVMPSADVVLVVGSRFVTNSGHKVPSAAGSTLIGMNAELSDLGDPRGFSVGIHGDARLGASALRDGLKNLGERPSRQAEVDDARLWAASQVEAIEPQNAWLRALRSALPDDGILVNELTQVGYLASVAYPVFAPNSYISPGYQGTLGYGFPTALGAKVADPSRAVVSITGDGGFGWCLSELSTARKYGIGTVTVVFNDGAFGNVRRIQREQFDGRFIASDLTNPDFVALAESFGITAMRVTEPDALEAALTDAFAANEPMLIEVPVAEMPSAWHLLLDPPTLEGAS